MATATYLTDLALELKKQGHEVTVICSQRAYDNPLRKFQAKEDWQGIRILRVWNTGFGKGALWRRLCDFLSFTISATLDLIKIPRHDRIICLTSPPLISVIAATVGKIRNIPVCNWVMDLNPDEAIAMGILPPGGIKTKILKALQRFAFRNSDRILTLDHYMSERIKTNYVSDDRVHAENLWSHDNITGFDQNGRLNFRTAHGLHDKFIVMYSGNHSPCHPLDAILEAALELKAISDIHFMFIGGGVRFAGVAAFAATHNLTNITCLPYQPSESLTGQLSGADLHLVVMGDEFVGLVHPCKIYNILASQRPFLFIGPWKSHIGDIIQEHKIPTAYARHAPNGDVSAIQAHIKEAYLNRDTTLNPEGEVPTDFYTKERLCPRLASLITGVENQPTN